MIDFETYIVKHNAHEYIERNPKEVHDCAPRLLGNVLGSHLHQGWPKYSDTCLKGTEAEKQDTTTK